MAGFEGRIADVILEKVNIVDLISNYVLLKRTGRNHKACCPFHNEKTPSFVVSDDKQRYHCFGCGVSGDAIAFVMEKEHLDFIDAVEWLADKYNVDLEPYRRSSGTKGPAGGQDRRKEYMDISREAAIVFFKALKKNQKALQYLENRGINEEMARQFAIGYATEGWDDLVKHFSPQKHMALEKVGLLSKKRSGTGYVDLFRDRLMFPIFNVQGKIVGFGGRIMGEGHPKYLNSPDSEIFSKSNLLYGLNFVKAWPQSQKRIVVVEGYMDVIQLHQAGYKGAVATLGTALTKQHGDILSRYTEEIVVCYDGDQAGIKAAIRSVDVLKNIKANVRVLILPDGMDPDDFIKSRGIEAFETLLKDAEPALNFYLSELQKQHDILSETGRVGIVQAFGEILNDLDNAITKDIYIKRLAELIRVTETAVLEHLRKIKGNKASNGGSQNTGQPQDASGAYNHHGMGQKLENEIRGTTSKSTKKGPMQQIEVRLMEIALMGIQPFEVLMRHVPSDSIQTDSVRKVIEGLAVYYSVYAEVNGDTLAEVFDLEMSQKLMERKKQMVPITDMQREMEATVIKHRELLIDEEIRILRLERQRTADNQLLQDLMNKEMELKKMKSRMRQGLDHTKGGQAFE